MPNSGITVPFSVFKLDASTARNSFAYNIGFGIEGTIFADLVLILGCVLLFMWGRKKKSVEVVLDDFRNLWEQINEHYSLLSEAAKHADF